MSAHQIAAFPAPPPNPPPAYPLPDESLPLPDHFPEPYVDPETDSRSSRTSATLETGATLVFNPGPAGEDAKQNTRGDVTQNVVYARGDVTQNRRVTRDSYSQVAPKENEVTTNGVVDEAKEGIRRITDKYAAPETLLRNAPSIVADSYRLSASSGHHPYNYRPESPAHSRVSQMSVSSSGTPPLPSTPTLLTPGLATHADSMSRLQVEGEAGSRGSLQGLGSSAFSDASSDISDSSSVPPWSASEQQRSSQLSSSLPDGSPAGGERGGRIQSIGGLSMTSLGEGVTDQDIQQVEMFYKSHKCEVTVCHCLANLYFGSANSSSDGDKTAKPSPSGSDSWDFVSTGIPVLILDSGQHVRTRQLSILLAEKGTGFVLWRDVMSHLTNYACLHANFHTLRVSADSKKLAGLSFDDSKAAADFAATIKQLTSDPDDDLLMLSKKGKKKKKKQESKKLKYKPPKKTDISQPCCFQHVTKLERPQIGGSLPPPPNGFPPTTASNSMSSLSDVFHDRLSLSTSRARSQSSELSLELSGRSEH